MVAYPRARVLPLAGLGLVLLFLYFYYSSSDKFDLPSWTPSTSSKPNKGNVLMVTASSGDKGFMSIPGLKEMVYENRLSYAHRHGYDHMWANISSYTPPVGGGLVWNKIPILQEALVRYPSAEWIWWLDLDIILMNQTLSMWDHLLSPAAMAKQASLNVPLNQPGGSASGYTTPSTYDYDQVNFLIAAGGWGMNAGNFLIRRSYWADFVLDLWFEPLFVDQQWVMAENDAWTHMWRHHPIVQRHTVVTNQRALNAFPDYNTLGEHWQQGDLSVHFAGCGASPECASRWDEYWQKRGEYEVPEVVRQKLADGTAEIEDVQMGVGLPVHDLP